jgi:hypothetical protein
MQDAILNRKEKLRSIAIYLLEQECTGHGDDRAVKKIQPSFFEKKIAGICDYQRAAIIYQHPLIR